MKSWMTILAMLVLAGRAAADVVPPDSKRITHVARFENIRDYPDHAFFIHPRDLPRGAPGNSSVRVDPSGEAELSALNPFAVHQSGGVRLFAVPMKLMQGRSQPEDEWFEGSRTGVVRSDTLVAPQKYISNWAPEGRRVTTYRLSGLPGSLTLTLVSDEIPSALSPGKLLVGAGVAAAAAIALFLRIRRRRRPSP